VPVWFGERELLVEGRANLGKGDTLKVILNYGLLGAERCVTLVSPRALTSDWVAGFEWKHFERREADAQRPLMFPILTGTETAILLDALPHFLRAGDRSVFDWPDPRYSDDVLQALMDTLGFDERFVPQKPPRVPAGSVTRRAMVETPERVLKVSIEIGEAWTQLSSMIPGTLMKFEHEDSGMILNLVVGPMPPDAVADMDEHNPEDVEIENIYADGVFRTLRFMSLGVNTRQLLASHLINLPWTGGPPPLVERRNGEKVEWAPAETRQHMAFSYRSFGRFHRKYAILVRPGPIEDRKHFEFVFTTFLDKGPHGTWEAFLERVGEVDDIVRSLRVVQHRVCPPP